MALVLFIVILAYHIILQIRGTKQCKVLNIELNLLKFKNTDDVNYLINKAVNDNAENFSQFCESLLGDSPKLTYGDSKLYY